jgi:serine/threonine protein kinase
MDSIGPEAFNSNGSRLQRLKEYLLRFPELVIFEESWRRPAESSRKKLDRLVIPGYQIGRELGRGGMGVVFEALHVDTQRQMAIKLINANWANHPVELARFRIEMEVLSYLDHPRIVRLRDIGFNSGFPWYAMDFIRGNHLGADLKNQLRTNPDECNLQDILRIVADVARTVHYAHEKGIIHRDLKPANILLDDNRTPFVTDFGIARLVVDRQEMVIAETVHLEWPAELAFRNYDNFSEQSTSHNRTELETALEKIFAGDLTDSEIERLLNIASEIDTTQVGAVAGHSATGQMLPPLTQTGELLGTPYYMAPEQIDSGFGPITHQTDIYALGVILFELITGHRPFDGPISRQLFRQICRRKSPSVSDFCEGLPADLDLGCLAKAPRLRYSSALDLARDLETFEVGQVTRRKVERRIIWRAYKSIVNNDSIANNETLSLPVAGGPRTSDLIRTAGVLAIVTVLLIGVYGGLRFLSNHAAKVAELEKLNTRSANKVREAAGFLKVWIQGVELNSQPMMMNPQQAMDALQQVVDSESDQKIRAEANQILQSVKPHQRFFDVANNLPLLVPHLQSLTDIATAPSSLELGPAQTLEPHFLVVTIPLKNCDDPKDLANSTFLDPEMIGACGSNIAATPETLRSLIILQWSKSKVGERQIALPEGKPFMTAVRYCYRCQFSAIALPERKLIVQKLFESTDGTASTISVNVKRTHIETQESPGGQTQLRSMVRQEISRLSKSEFAP